MVARRRGLGSRDRDPFADGLLHRQSYAAACGPPGDRVSAAIGLT
jgi:hypothetical protein